MTFIIEIINKNEGETPQPYAITPREHAKDWCDRANDHAPETVRYQYRPIISIDDISAPDELVYDDDGNPIPTFDDDFHIQDDEEDTVEISKADIVDAYYDGKMTEAFARRHVGDEAVDLVQEKAEAADNALSGDMGDTDE